MTTPEASQQSPPSPWMTLGQTAAYLKISYDECARLCNAGRIRRSKREGKNGTVRVHRDWADDYLKSLEVVEEQQEEPRPLRGRRARAVSPT